MKNVLVDFRHNRQSFKGDNNSLYVYLQIRRIDKKLLRLAGY